MKRLILATILGCMILLHGSVTFGLTIEQQNAIDGVVTRWHARQPKAFLAARTQKILDRINDLQSRARLTETAATILNHVELRLTNILNALEGKPLLPIGTSSGTTATGTTTTTPVTSGVFPTTMSIPERFDTNPLLIAGAVSPLFWEIKYTVSGEPMDITEVSIQSSRSDIEGYVREFALYDEVGNFVASTTNDGRTISFANLSLNKNIGSHSFYVALVSYGIDNLYSTDPVVFSLSSPRVYAEGSYSNSTITPSVSTNTSPQITLSPVGISTVQFIDSRNGYRASSSLNSTQTHLGIFEINTPATTSNEQETIVLDTISVTVTDNTVARQIAQSLRLERIDSGSSTSVLGTVNGNIVQFQVASLGNATIEQGQKAVFRLTGSFPLDSSIRESAQVSIGNLKEGAITYHLEGDSTPITTVQQWIWEVFGPMMSD